MGCSHGDGRSRLCDNSADELRRNRSVPSSPNMCLATTTRTSARTEFARSNWKQNKSPRRTDGWCPYDALFRVEQDGQVFYELYDPEPSAHGVWELAADSSGVMRPRRVAECLDIAAAQEQLDASEAFDASDERDGRIKVFTSIARRLGQPKFRRELLDAYGERCAVTGCPVLEILEGAHIKPYRGPQTNHVTNGILLRADVHTLFDLGLLRISPDSMLVEVSVRARSAYGEYHGRGLQLPANVLLQPNAEALRQHYEGSAAHFVTVTEVSSTKVQT